MKKCYLQFPSHLKFASAGPNPVIINDKEKQKFKHLRSSKYLDFFCLKNEINHENRWRLIFFQAINHAAVMHISYLALQFQYSFSHLRLLSNFWKLRVNFVHFG